MKIAGDFYGGITEDWCSFANNYGFIIFIKVYLILDYAKLIRAVCSSSGVVL
jgi:hypothetical protein